MTPPGGATGFHPLRHADVFAHGGITQKYKPSSPAITWPEFETDPQLKIDAIATPDAGRHRLHFVLNAQRGQACADRVILSAMGAAEDRHDSVAGELVHGAAITLANRTGRESTRLAMISRKRFGTDLFGAMSIEWTTSANNTVTCLYSADGAWNASTAFRTRCRIWRLRVLQRHTTAACVVHLVSVTASCGELPDG